MDAVGILPEEVWRQLLTDVKDPKDLLSCSNTCTLFKDLLYDTQSEWMLSLVFPQIFEYLPGSDVLNCRLVSKHVKKVVDTFLQSDDYRPALMYSLIQQPKQPKVFTKTLTNIENTFFQICFVRCKDQSPKFIHEFLSYPYHQPNKNPFLAGAVSVVFALHEMTSVMNLFTQFGKYIYSLDMYIKLFGNPTLCDVLQLILNIFKLTPNLKYLHIDGDIMMLRNERRTVLEQFVASNSAPKLDHLKVIELYTSNLYVNQAIKIYYAAKHVTIFEILDVLPRSSCFSADLKKLVFCCPQNKWRMIWEKLQNRINLPLEVIKVQVSTFEDFGEILACLLKYRLSLKHFTLNFNGLKIENIEMMARNWNYAFHHGFLPKMPELREFNVESDPVVCPVQFHKFVDLVLEGEGEEANQQQVGIRFTRMGSGVMNGSAYIMGKVRRVAKKPITN